MEKCKLIQSEFIEFGKATVNANKPYTSTVDHKQDPFLLHIKHRT